MLYTTIIREEDGYIAVETFEDSDEKVRDMIKYMRERIDAELKTDDPWNEKEDREALAG